MFFSWQLPINRCKISAISWFELLERFFLIFHRMRELRAREPRSEEYESRRNEKKKSSGYLGLESHFHTDASCQTRQFDNSKGTNGRLIMCLSAANVSTRVVRSGIFWPTWPESMCVFSRVFSSATITKVRFCLLNILRSKYLHNSFCNRASGLPNRKA